MAYLEKAIKLRYIYLTLKQKLVKVKIRAPISAACIDIFQFIQKCVFDYNARTAN